MRNTLKNIFLILLVAITSSCSKTDSSINSGNQETITISASSLNVSTGTVVNFTVLSSNNNSNVTSSSKIFVNGTEITGNSYTFNTVGSFNVNATKGTINSNTISVNVTAATIAAFKHKVLVEEYSGTWCGNCPRILHAVELLKQQTNNAVVVGIHLSGSDPFISTDGNALANQEGVTSVPTGKLNRTTNWTGPQNQNVTQVINLIQATSNTGIAIRSSVMGTTLNATINVGYAQPLGSNAKLVVYVVEDKLKATQANYSSTLYSGQSSIPNFNYDGVLRKAISSLQGDAIPNTGADNAKDYTLTLPTNIANIANAKIVAFVLNGSGVVVNAQEAKIGETKGYER